MREAARFEGLSWQEFEDLPGTTEVAEQFGVSNSKCSVIAHYRMHNLYEAVMADLQVKFPPKR